MLLSIDPGRNSGFAIFDSETLVWVGKEPPPPAWLESITRAVIERPTIYPHGKTPNPNDIVQLAWSAGEMAGALAASGITVTSVGPQAWKGTIDKDTCCRRVWSKLRPDEQYVAAAFRPEAEGKVRKGKDHVLDAIGIGLYALGRLRVRA